jgi:hypothetical protein
MEFVFEEAVALLRRTPRVLDAWLGGLAEPWVRVTEGGDTWCPFEVVGHLIHGEHTDWIPRVRMILEHGERREFTPYDRFAQARLMRDRTLDSLLDELRSARDANLQTLTGLHLTPADLARTGRHPELGPVTLAQLLATWVAHDLDHLVQVARVMAKRYRDDVGPWTAYLSVMTR